MTHEAITIETKIESGEYYLIQNPTSSAVIWRDNLRLIAHNKDNAEVIIQSWCACLHCKKVFKTHSDPDEGGNRKNYGLSSMQRHINNCVKLPKTHTQQYSISKFVTVKKVLSKTLSENLKFAEARFVISGMHSFQSVEDEGLVQLAQTCINIGSEAGNVNIKNIWYGRKTVRDKTIDEFQYFTKKLQKIVAEAVSKHEFAICTDLWTDDHVKRSYLDFTGFWLNNWELQHTMLRCKVFEFERKTAANIQAEIQTIMTQFDIVSGDTPITTDAGANIVAALREESRYQCMAHRLSTVLSDAWKRSIANDLCLKAFDNAIKDVSGFIHRSDISSDDLPATLKSYSATRPWRSFYDVHHSFFVSYEKLRDILENRGMSHRLIAVSPNLLQEIVNFFEPFNKIFDHLEMATVPTMQNVIPTYYLIRNILSQCEESAFSCIPLLRQYVQEGLDNKYWSSTTMIHQVATLLDPTFRQLSFIDDTSFRREVILNVKESIKKLSTYIEVNDCTIQLPTPKVSKSDPFLSLRSSTSTGASATLSTSCKIEELVLKEFDAYLTTSIEDTSTNPLIFWRTRQSEYICLSQIARKIYVIQASSGESERHFSAAGATLDSRRSNLAPVTLESLVVLKEACGNGLWP